jgi:hypothetical protein
MVEGAALREVGRQHTGEVPLDDGACQLLSHIHVQPGQGGGGHPVHCIMSLSKEQSRLLVCRCKQPLPNSSHLQFLSESDAACMCYLMP